MIGAEFRHAKPGECCCGVRGEGAAQACADELDGAPGGEPCRCSCHALVGRPRAYSPELVALAEQVVQANPQDFSEEWLDRLVADLAEFTD